MLLVVVAVRWQHSPLIELWPVGLLVISGVIGIGIGDTAFFAALNRLGERRTVLMAETLAPPIAALIAFVVLAEVLPATATIGIAITISGVAWVVVEQTSETKLHSSQLKAGIAFGLVAAICQAVGAVLSRASLTQSEIGPVNSSLIRIAGGVAILLIWMPIAGHRYFPDSVRRAKPWRIVLLATFVGTFLGIILQQLSLQHTEAGIVQTLLGTSSLFVLPLVALRGETISMRACLGAVIAVGGIALLFLSN
jgi:drug/metabolite transporter (DMT)-like permease